MSPENRQPDEIDPGLDGVRSERERDIGQIIIERIRSTVNEDWPEIGEPGVDAFTSLYLRPRDGCVPNWFIGDELLDDVIDLFDYPLAAVRDELAERQGVFLGEIPVLIMPSWQSDTMAVMFTRDRVLLQLSQKAWSFWWDSEDEMAGEMKEWYLAVESGLTRAYLLLENDRQALKDVLDGVSVNLPQEEPQRRVDPSRLQSAAERLRRLI